MEDWVKKVIFQINVEEGIKASTSPNGSAAAMTPEQLHNYDREIAPLGHDPTGFDLCGELEYLEVRKAREKFIEAMKLIGGEIW